MKRFCLLLSVISLCALCLLFLPSCASELEMPKNLRLDMATQVLSWKKCNGAVGYTLLIGENEIVTRSTSYSLEKLDPGDYVIKVKANGDGDATQDSAYAEFTFTREKESGLRYKLINNNQEYQLVGIGTATGDVVMESTFRGKPVTSIAASALSGNSRITSFVIGENVTEIGKKAFYNSKALKSVTIPEGVTKIGLNAFQTCTLLQSVTLPSTVTELPDYAFGYCRGLTSLTLSPNLKSIGIKAFTDCESLVELVIPDSVETVGRDAFSNCDSLVSVKLGSGMTEVPGSAFYRCKALKNVTMSENIKTIGSYAFGECKALTAVTLPEALEVIGEFAFSACEQLSDVTVGASLREIGLYAFSNTALYQQAGDIVYLGNWILGCKNTAITQKELQPLLREDTVGIATAAFYQCKEIEAVKLPNVKFIGDYAFCECISLLGYSYTVFSGELETIGDYAFAGCTLLDSFYFGEKLQTIETYAFYGCVRLKEVSLPDTLTKIGTRAFNDTGIYNASNGVVYADKWAVANKNGMGDVKLNNGTVGIADYCFYQQWIEKVTLPDTVQIIGRGAFYECVIITIESLPLNLKTIGDYAFYNCAYAQFGAEDLILRLPLGLESIGRSAFYQAQLIGVTIPGTVKTIGDYAFFGCTLLGAPEVQDMDGNVVARGVLVLGEGIESIGTRAFYNCAGLETLVIPNSVTSLGVRVFNKCISLKNVTIGSGLTALEDYMFYDCASIESIVICDGVTKIGRYAFRGCKALKSIDFGNSIEVIGDYAFLGCESLKSVVLPNSVKEIGKYAFRGLISATSIYVSDNVEVIGQHAFYGCNIATIYCEDTGLQRLWHERFNSSFRPIVFGVSFAEDGSYVTSFTMTEGALENSDAKDGMTGPRREGYVFEGWATSPDGEVVYEAADVATAPVGTVLYAVYSAGQEPEPVEPAPDAAA